MTAVLRQHRTVNIWLGPRPQSGPSAVLPSPGRCRGSSTCGLLQRTLLTSLSAYAAPHGGNGVHSHGHDHHQGHRHGHDHHHHHHHEHHNHGHHHHHHDNLATRLMERIGLSRLAEAIEHSWACTAVSMGFFVAALLVQAPALAQALPSAVAEQLHKGLLYGTFVLSGIPQLVESVGAMASGQIDTHVLMSLAVLGTLYMGLAQEGALLLLLFQISHFLEDKFTARASGSLERLFAAVPSKATIITVNPDNSPDLSTAVAVQAASVKLSQYVLIKPGEQVPLDGDVVWGTANVSLQHISGESQPVRVTVRAPVPAGALNYDGLLVVRVTAASADSTPARIARMASEARANKALLERKLDKVGAVWSKAVIAVTLATLVVLPLLGVPLLGPHGALYRAMGVLTAGSPCAVVLVPLAYVCAIATVTRKGVLVKGAGALDDLHSCTHVALDKTGTITTGALKLTEGRVISLEGAASPAAAGHNAHVGSGAMHTSRALQLDASLSLQASAPLSSSTVQQLDGGSSSSNNGGSGVFDALALQCAVALSRASNHPVASAMMAYGASLPSQVTVSHFEQVPGAGVQGVCRIGGTSEPLFVRFGSLDFVKGALGPSAAERLDAAVEAEAAGSNGSGGRSQQQASKAISYVSISTLDDMSEAAAAGNLGSFGPLDSTLLQTAPSASSSGNGSHGSSGSHASSSDGVSAAALLGGVEPSQVVAAVRGAQSGGRQLVAVLSLEDVVQGGVAASVAALQDGSWRRGRPDESKRKEVVMLTGDNVRVAEAVASTVGLTRYMAALKPEDKLSYVQSFAKENSTGVLMMGDGINDAPALAAARVGVAVALTPTDMAASAADMIVLNGQGVANLPWLFRLAHQTQVVVAQNLTLALAAVAFATLPTVAGVFPLWLAVLLHEGSTVLVALNSLRLLLDPQDPGFSSSLHSVWQGLRMLATPLEPVAVAGAEGAEGGSLPAHGHDHNHNHNHHGHEHHCDHDHNHEHNHQHQHAHAQHHGCDHDHGHDHHDHDHGHKHGRADVVAETAHGNGQAGKQALQPTSVITNSTGGSAAAA